MQNILQNVWPEKSTLSNWEEHFQLTIVDERVTISF